MRWIILSCLGFLAGCEGPETDAEQKKDEAPNPEEDAKAWRTTEPADWKVIGFGGEGSARWEDGVLKLDVGVELTGVKFVGDDLPEMPYELELEARKVAGTDFFCGLTFPVSSPGECVTLVVGGWGGGTVGISSIDGLDASENETTSYHKFENDRWYDIRVVVREDELLAYLDGEKVVEVKTEGRELGLRPGVIEDCAPLGLAAFQTAAEMRHLRWRSLAD